MTKDLSHKINDMMKEFSNFEIAESLKVSISTVKRVIKENRFSRSREETVAIRSRTRRDLIRAERRRAIFGLDQKTGIKVFTNREKSSLKYCLKRRKYKFLRRGDNIAYYDKETNRYPPYEERGIKLGLKFRPIEIQYQ